MPKQKFYPTLFQHLATDTSRNLVVSAGAGAGKTAVLTRRIIKILREEELSLEQIMVVTFTDKAAVEMKERIYAAIDAEIGRSGNDHFRSLKDDFLQNRISTFHAFCANLLRQYPIEAQIDPYFRVMDENDKIFFLKKVIDRCMKELAEKKDQPDLAVLSREWSKSEITRTIYDIIQKREHTGPWLAEYLDLAWPAFLEKLHACQKNTFIEIAHKLLENTPLREAAAGLKEARPEPEDDDSKLSMRRLRLLEVLPLFIAELEKIVVGEIELEKVVALKNEIEELCNLSGSNAKAWAANPDKLELLRVSFLQVRNLMKLANFDNFLINEAVEEEGFEICKSLARIALYCLNAYRDNKAKEHFLDFQDLQLKVLALLQAEKQEHILQELREKFIYIMVDDFQDTNGLQWDIVQLLASDSNRQLFGDGLFIVGDEKQAIYSFRGGDVTLFGKVKDGLARANQARQTHAADFNLVLDEHGEKNYEQEYRQHFDSDQTVKSGKIIFSDNFRSAAKPIHFFNVFFDALMSKKVYDEFESEPQKLICSGNKKQGSVEFLFAKRSVQKKDEALQLGDDDIELDVFTKEGMLIAGKIKEALTGDDPLYESVRERAAAGKAAIAILLNRRTKLKVYEEALRRQNIDFIVVRGRGFFQRREIMDIGNILGFLADSENSIYLAGFLRSSVCHVTDDAIFLISRLGRGETLWQKLTFSLKEDTTIVRQCSEADQAALKQAFALLQRWQQLCRRLPLIEFLRLLLDEGCYYAALARGKRGEQALSNIEKLLDYARNATMSVQDDFLSFTEWLNERIDFIEEEGEADVDAILGGTVQLMTVHQSKGLEFPMVFVPDLNAGFNFGDKTATTFGDVTAELEIGEDDKLKRQLTFECGTDVVDPENEYEPTGTLIKKITERRNREKIIAEKKRLLYVAATRAMDHLVLVGQLKNPGAHAAQQEEAASMINSTTNWMDWFCKIFHIATSIEGTSGILKLERSGDEPLRIPYRIFTDEQNVTQLGEEMRADFSADAIAAF